jgi:hypothetical protein
LGAVVTTGSAVVAPRLANLAIRTITSHMSSLTADTTDDAGGEVLLLRAVVLSVTDLAAVLASLVLVVTKGTVKGGELTELVALKFILAFGDGSSLEVVSMGLARVKEWRVDLQSR